MCNKEMEWARIVLPFHRILVIGISIACVSLASLSYDSTETEEQVFFLTVFTIVLVIEILVPFLWVYVFYGGNQGHAEFGFCIGIPLYVIFSTVFGLFELSAGLLYPPVLYEETDSPAKRGQRHTAMMLAFVNSALHILLTLATCFHAWGGVKF